MLPVYCNISINDKSRYKNWILGFYYIEVLGFVPEAIKVLQTLHKRAFKEQSTFSHQYILHTYKYTNLVYNKKYLTMSSKAILKEEILV